MIPPKLFDIFSPLTEGCSEGLDAFRFFFKQMYLTWVNVDPTYLALIAQVRVLDHKYGITKEM